MKLNIFMNKKDRMEVLIPTVSLAINSKFE